MRELPVRVEEFLNYLQYGEPKSLETIDGYRIDLKILFRYLKYKRDFANQDVNIEIIDNLDISDIDDNFIKNITKNDLNNYKIYISKYRKNQEQALNRKISAVKSFYNYLCDNDILENNVAAMLKKSKIPKRNPVYMDIDESKTYINAISKDEDSRFQIRNLTMINIMLHCGVRIRELCNLNVSSIRKDILTVIGKGNKEREIGINEKCQEIIANYLEWRKEFENKLKDKNVLFFSSRYQRITTRAVETMVKSYGEEINMNKTITPHKLRHSCASLLYDAGVGLIEIQEILGHENISTTNRYTHINSKKLKTAVSMNPLND